MEQYVDRPRYPSYVSYAEQYEPGGRLGELLAIARKKDPDATVVEVPELRVLVVRYQHAPDHHPMRVEYRVVEAGNYLVYSEGFDLLYDTDPQAFTQEYERVLPDG